MIQNEQEINKLTRSLMQGTAEQPSSDLNSRIMAIIRKSTSVRKVFQVSKPVSAGQLFGVFFVYMLLIAGGLLLLQKYSLGTNDTSDLLKELFPLILTIVGGVSFFIFFGQLDNYLYKQKHQKASKE